MTVPNQRSRDRDWVDLDQVVATLATIFHLSSHILGSVRSLAQ
jgi:hypothetical protein